MSEAAANASKPVWTAGLVLRNALAVAANLLVLYGVLRWGWDGFQILILYWCETGIAAFWALAKLYFLPQSMLGSMTVNGRVVPATNRLLLEMFVMVFGVFLTVHLGVLWIFFSEGSAAAVNGPLSFVRELVFASAAWLPLLLAFAAGFIDFVRTPKRESFVLQIERWFAPRRGFIATDAALKADGVGPAIASPLIRIVLMQVAVIFGAMMVRKFGTDVPFYILIGLKMLVDISQPTVTKPA
jgi:hypothetical protein